MSETNLNRTLSGKVVSDRMDKTITVLVERKVKHPLYGKIIVRSKKYHVHDEGNAFHTGDAVSNRRMPSPVQNQGLAGRQIDGKGPVD